MLYARKGAVILGFNSKRVMFCDRGYKEGGAVTHMVRYFAAL